MNDAQTKLDEANATLNDFLNSSNTIGNGQVNALVSKSLQKLSFINIFKI